LVAIASEEGRNQTDVSGNEQDIPTRQPRRRFGWRLDAVAAFTGLLTIVTGTQVWAFIQSERASVTVVAIGPNTPIKSNQPLVFGLIMRNGGKSTADIVDGNVTLNFGPNKLPEKPRYIPGNVTIEGQIISGTDFHSTFRPHVVFSEEQIAAFQAGRENLYVYGFVSYTDDFSILGPKVVGFCARFNPVNMTDRTASLGTLDTCGIRNYSYRR
jgi:hypothetical protein